VDLDIVDISLNGFGIQYELEGRIKIMPKDGFKTISIKSNIFDSLSLLYKELKISGKLPNGINSFSAYVCYRILNRENEIVSWKNLSLKIDNIPEKFLENKFIIKKMVMLQ